MAVITHIIVISTQSQSSSNIQNKTQIEHHNNEYINIALNMLYFCTPLLYENYVNLELTVSYWKKTPQKEHKFLIDPP